MTTARNLRQRFATSRRRVSLTVRTLLVLPLAVAAACSDTTAPATPALTASPSAPALYAGNSGATAPTTQTFVYDGTARVQSFGDGHSVSFDANSVCDPTTSGYGLGLWDTPCTPAQGPITFTVTSWRDVNGRPQVTFSPDVRFVPGTTEVLYLNDNPGAGQKAVVQWCSAQMSGCVNEAATDPTLTTWVASGKVARRVKHFSGYNVIFGLTDPTTTSGF